MNDGWEGWRDGDSSEGRKEGGMKVVMDGGDEWKERLEEGDRWRKKWREGYMKE